MSRTRTDLRAFAALLLAGLLALGALAPRSARAEDSAERAAAREHFAKGLALAKAHDYAAALSEFQQAYAAVPHFGVLFNIGQAQVALARPADAVATLLRYLDEGGANIDAGRRAEVEATIARQRQQLPPEPPRVDGALAPPVKSAPPVNDAPPVNAPPVNDAPPAPLPAPAPSTPAPAPSAPAATDIAAASPAPRLAPAPHSAARRERAHREKRASPESRRVLAYALGGAGVALSGGALAHYFWNRSRYRDWQDAYSHYFRDPTEPNRNAANQLSKSIDDASAVTVVLALGAGVALGTSGVLWITSGAPGSASSHGGFEPFLSAAGKF